MEDTLIVKKIEECLEMVDVEAIARTIRPFRYHCSLSRCTIEGIPIRKLFIGNLANRTTNKDLEHIFSAYGKVEGCYLKRNNNGGNIAFVTFESAEDAFKAREAATRTISLHCRILRVSPADSWHQPDSPENQKKFLSSIISNEKPQEDVSTDDAPINVLNDDCLREIFLCLPITDRIRMERVCKRWQAISLESWRTAKRLDLSSKSWGLKIGMRIQFVDTPALRKVLFRCGSFLEHIDASDPHVLGSSAVTIIGKFCPNLRIVDLSRIYLSQAGIRSLWQNCNNITEFTIEQLIGSCEKELSKLFAVNKKLKVLKIENGDHLNGKCLSHLPCETMEEIDLQHGVYVSSYHMEAALKRCDKLKSLSLSFCVCFGDSTFQMIGTRKTLTTLKLLNEFPILSVAGLQNISQLVNLENLTIRKNYLLTDTVLHLLAANCKRLSLLDIYACSSVTNDGLTSIATLPNLQHLVISYIVNVTDEALAGLHNLRTLECHRCVSLEDIGVSNLIEAAPNLKLLDLSGCLITNYTLEVAIQATKRRSNNTILKIIVGDTLTKLTEITEVSPLLQIVNVCLDF